MSWGEKPSNFIQWKGTDVCMDVICGCGAQYHVDQEMFLYFVRCGACGRTYELGTEVSMHEKPVEPGSAVYDLRLEEFD